ncbi:hypothetical protein [Micromonospora marina]|uniref:hypothetical protein n=1 Tax=Micromonospora marina TaxID=307120 RepID=UPI00345147EA
MPEPAEGESLVRVEAAAVAQYVTVPTAGVSLLPEGLPPSLGATYFVPLTTAVTALHMIGRTGAWSIEGVTSAADDVVIVAGATGAVGSLAAQLALREGARVYGLVLDQQQAQRLPTGVEPLISSVGGDDLAVLAEERPVTLLVDTLGGQQLIERLGWVRAGGRAVSIGYVAGKDATLDLPNWLLLDVPLLPVNMIRRSVHQPTIGTLMNTNADPGRRRGPGPAVAAAADRGRGRVPARRGSRSAGRRRRSGARRGRRGAGGPRGGGQPDRGLGHQRGRHHRRHASAGVFVLAAEGRSLGDRDLRELRMEVRRNGVVVATGSGGDNFYGDPVRGLTWLAGEAHRWGTPLRAGQVVLAGALGPMVEIKEGDSFSAVIGDLPGVSVHFPVQPRGAGGGCAGVTGAGRTDRGVVARGPTGGARPPDDQGRRPGRPTAAAI